MALIEGPGGTQLGADRSPSRRVGSTRLMSCADGRSGAVTRATGPVSTGWGVGGLFSGSHHRLVRSERENPRRIPPAGGLTEDREDAMRPPSRTTDRQTERGRSGMAGPHGSHRQEADLAGAAAAAALLSGVHGKAKPTWANGAGVSERGACRSGGRLDGRRTTCRRANVMALAGELVGLHRAPPPGTATTGYGGRVRGAIDGMQSAAPCQKSDTRGGKWHDRRAVRPCVMARPAALIIKLFFLEPSARIPRVLAWIPALLLRPIAGATAAIRTRARVGSPHSGGGLSRRSRSGRGGDWNTRILGRDTNCAARVAAPLFLVLSRPDDFASLVVGRNHARVAENSARVSHRTTAAPAVATGDRALDRVSSAVAVVSRAAVAVAPRGVRRRPSAATPSGVAADRCAVTPGVAADVREVACARTPSSASGERGLRRQRRHQHGHKPQSKLTHAHPSHPLASLEAAAPAGGLPRASMPCSGRTFHLPQVDPTRSRWTCTGPLGPVQGHLALIRATRHTALRRFSGILCDSGNSRLALPGQED